MRSNVYLQNGVSQVSWKTRLVEQIIKRSGAWQRKLTLDFCCCKIWDSKHGNKVIYFQMRIPKSRVKFEYKIERKQFCFDLESNEKVRAEEKQAIQYDLSCRWKDCPAPARSSWQNVEQENPYLERRNLFQPHLLRTNVTFHESILKNKSSEAWFWSTSPNPKQANAQSQFIRHIVSFSQYGQLFLRWYL